MVGGGGTTITQPDPIDPYLSANAQLGMNYLSTLSNVYGNRIGQNTPYGSLSYSTDGYIQIDPKTGQVKQVKEIPKTGASPLSAADFAKYAQYVPHTGNKAFYDKLSKDDKAKIELVRGYKNYDAYVNNFTANAPKYLPNQVQNVNLSPEQKKLLDLQQKQDIQSATINNSQMDRVGKTLGTAFNPTLNAYNTGAKTSGFSDLNFEGNPNLPGVNDFSKERQKVEDAVYSRFDKRFARDEESLRTRLANQGIVTGSDAWNAEMEALNQAKNDARNQAILSGGDEQSRMFGLGMDARQQANQEDVQTTLSRNQNREAIFNQGQQKAVFDNQLRGQQLQEELARRQLPLQEYASLRSGQQIQNPNFQPFYQMNLQGGDVQGAMQNQFDQQMSAYNASVAQKNNAKAGTNDLVKTGVMTGAMAFSDRRLKKDYVKVGNFRGFNIYYYLFLLDRTFQIGVMADEVQAVRPDCVMMSSGGYLMVDYGRLFSNDNKKEGNLNEYESATIC